MTTMHRRFRLRFFTERPGEGRLAHAIAELVMSGAVQIEVGRMRHRSRTSPIEEPPFTEPLQRQLLGAVFLPAAANQGWIRGIAPRMAEHEYMWIKDASHFEEWEPVPLGDGFVPLGFVGQEEPQRSDRDTIAIRIGVLMKFLTMRFELELRWVPARRRWHVLTFHHTSEDAARLRSVFNKNAPEIEFD